MRFQIVLSALMAITFVASGASPVPPKLDREFRAGWVPSVGNSQWPSKRGLTVEQQKTELLAILERAQVLKLNAIVLQIRPACDALYASKLEPWSEYLTGTMGKAPEPFYDPLAFAVTEAHKRGLELHAWVNPYRAHNNKATSPISANHVSKKFPGMIIPYGKYLWLDPSQKAVQDYSIAVISDIVRRYDIDGLHMDDYFYPYIEKDEATKKNMPFPDDASWQKYLAAGGKMTRGDWRRDNINTFVARSYQTIKAQKPWVKFGVSPFGIWKPGFPATTSLKSGNMYEEIYCDSLKWWTNGWVDYLAPQLYWRINPPDQSFSALAKWWSDTNVKHRALWPGMNTGKVGGTNWAAEEIINQIKVTRETPGVTGHIHWPMTAVMNNKGGISDQLKTVYTENALVPALTWVNNASPAKPSIAGKRDGNGFKVQWKTNQDKPTFWVLQQQTGDGWKTEIFSGDKTSANISSEFRVVALSAINRYGAQSFPAILEIKK